MGKITWTHLIDFKVNKANAVLPTQPIIRLIKLKGEQRIDNDIELDNSTVYSFAVLDNAGKLPDDFPDCSSGCKGQEISEGNFGVFSFPKKQQRNISPISGLASKK